MAQINTCAGPLLVNVSMPIWLYLRFTLSFRDVQDLLAERAIMVSYETVRRWVHQSCHSCGTPAPRCAPLHAISLALEQTSTRF
jgi:transposase-like protein